jgi:glycosyltransferase involved in cell wall biosynthesis
LGSKNKRRIDVIVPVYNQEKYIRQTISSIQQQTYPHWQLIVVDDASTDQTPDVLVELSENNQRIKSITAGENSVGACHARNLGFRHGNSDYVLFLDSDDLLTETCLETRISTLKENPELDFVLGNTLLFDSQPYDLDILWNIASLDSEVDLLRFLRQDMPWHCMSPLWRRESFVQLGGWNEDLVAFQDWELHVRACYKNYRYSLAAANPDTFYRVPCPDRISIGASYLDELKIKARQSAIQSVARLDGFLNQPVRREHVESFCLRNALQLLDADMKAAAFSFLFSCIRKGLFRPTHALAALGILGRGKEWRGSRPARYLQSSLWSSECRIDPWEKVRCAA